jgi:hypothetical protein
VERELKEDMDVFPRPLRTCEIGKPLQLIKDDKRSKNVVKKMMFCEMCNEC